MRTTKKVSPQERGRPGARQPNGKRAATTTKPTVAAELHAVACNVNATSPDAPALTPQSHPFVDAKGRRHTSAVLKWHPAARKALGVVPFTPTREEGAQPISAD
jgi:hypothetical protein